MIVDEAAGAGGAGGVVAVFFTTGMIGVLAFFVTAELDFFEDEVVFAAEDGIGARDELVAEEIAVEATDEERAEELAGAEMICET